MSEGEKIDFSDKAIDKVCQVMEHPTLWLCGTSSERKRMRFYIKSIRDAAIAQLEKENEVLREQNSLLCDDNLKLTKELKEARLRVEAGNDCIDVELDKNRKLQQSNERLESEIRRLREIGIERSGSFFPMIERLMKDHEFIKAENERLTKEVERLKDGWDNAYKMAGNADKHRMECKSLTTKLNVAKEAVQTAKYYFNRLNTEAEELDYGDILALSIRPLAKMNEALATLNQPDRG